MTLVSVNIGKPRKVDAGGRPVRTSIWKIPREGRVAVHTLNLDGDRQSDLRVHGGPRKAVYVYPSEHYEYWRGELPDAELPWGAFGENLTTKGLSEDDVRIGDRIAIGSAEFEVTQSRQPCFKLGIRFGRDDMPARFIESGRSGFYVSVVREGDVGSGDAISVIARQSGGMTVTEEFRKRVKRK
jgi:MOSC domain-containing protein YiiM